MYFLKRYRLLLASCLLSFLTLSCSGGSADNGATSTHVGNPLPLGELQNVSIYINSSDLLSTSELGDLVASAFSAQTAESQIDNCHVSGSSDDEGIDGLCVTPVDISGYVANISLNSNTGGTAPARLLGTGIGYSRNGEIEGILVESFDDTDETLRGTDNLEDANANTAWQLLSLAMYNADITVLLPSGVDEANEFWTLRYAFISQPSTDDLDCIDEAFREKIETNGQLYEKDFRLGDVLFCKGEGCTPSQWCNTESNEATEMRPEDPVTHIFKDHIEVTCEIEDGRFNGQIGTASLIAELSESFTLAAEFNEGEEDGCTKQYTLNETQTGNTLRVDLDFSLDGSVFINDIADASELAILSDCAIVGAINLKQFVQRSRQVFPESPPENSDITVAAEFTLTDESVACPDSTEVDSQFLTGADCTPDRQLRAECTHPATDGTCNEDNPNDPDGLCCAPGFRHVDDTIWWVSENGEEEYCTKQVCAGENGGFPTTIYCIPDS